MTRMPVTSGPSRPARVGATAALIVLLWLPLAGRPDARSPQVVQASIEKGDVVFPIAPFEIKTIGIVFR